MGGVLFQNTLKTKQLPCFDTNSALMRSNNALNFDREAVSVSWWIREFVRFIYFYWRESGKEVFPNLRKNHSKQRHYKEIAGGSWDSKTLCFLDDCKTPFYKLDFFIFSLIWLISSLSGTVMILTTEII